MYVRKDATCHQENLQEEEILTEEAAGGSLPAGEDPVILAAKDLSPSDTLRMDLARLAGIVTEQGSVASHTAILARTMGIPAILGVPVGADWNGRMAVLDGEEGLVILGPEVDVMEVYRRRQREESEERARLEKLKGAGDVTLDGKEIQLMANIGSAREVVTKVLKYISFFISYCDSHSILIPLRKYFVLSGSLPPLLLLRPAAALSTASLIAGSSPADMIIPTGDPKRLPVDDTVRNLITGPLVNLRDGGPGNPHLRGTLNMGLLLIIHQTDHLILIHRQRHRLPGLSPTGSKTVKSRFRAHAAASAGSCHPLTSTAIHLRHMSIILWHR